MPHRADLQPSLSLLHPVYPVYPG